MKLQFPYILIFCATLAGCATNPADMSSKDCATADWRALGVADGQEGTASNRRDQRFASCAATASPADSSAYEAGYAEGLTTLCTPKGGYEYGLTGKDYFFVCPRSSEPAFIRTYQIGFDEFELKDKLRDAQRGLDRAERDMRNTQTNVKRLEAQYSGANQQDRQRMQVEINQLRRRVYEIQDERAQFEYAHNIAEENLKAYRKDRPKIPGVD